MSTVWPEGVDVGMIETMVRLDGWHEGGLDPWAIEE